MAEMVLGDPVTSLVKLTVTLLSCVKKSGNVLLFNNCEV